MPKLYENTRCPDCGGGTTRSREMIVKGGSRSWQGYSSRSGTSFSIPFRGFSFFSGSGSNWGRSRSGLADEATYCGFLATGLLWYLGAAFASATIEFWSEGEIISSLIFGAIAAALFLYPPLDWSKSWMCTKCGCKFNPSTIQNSRPVKQLPMPKSKLTRIESSAKVETATTMKISNDTTKRPLNALKEGSRGWYVALAAQKVGTNDLHRLTEEFSRLIQEDGIQIGSRQWLIAPQQYVAGYRSWLKSRGYI